MMKKLLIAITLAAATVLSVAADRFPELSTADLKKAISERKITLLDVNGSESWQAGHIPGALNFFAVKEVLASKLPADKSTLIVAYCANEQCPAYRAGAQAAKKLGYTNVRHYAHGIEGWKKDGEPTEKGD